jgi:hypothetical protein
MMLFRYVKLCVEKLRAIRIGLRDIPGVVFGVHGHLSKLPVGLHASCLSYQAAEQALFQKVRAGVYLAHSSARTVQHPQASRWK